MVHVFIKNLINQNLQTIFDSTFLQSFMLVSPVNNDPTMVARISTRD